MPQQHEFGGDWTSEKLERVKKYLAAYAMIMSKQQFRFAYIDAFAGTGYRTLSQEDNPNELISQNLQKRKPKTSWRGQPASRFKSCLDSINTFSSKKIFKDSKS